MGEGFKNWSHSNLGQWHYVLGYLVILITHNWPIMLALVLALIFSVRLYIRPTRIRAGWLFSALLLGLAYEYQKHVADEFHKAVDFLFGLEIGSWNMPLHFIISKVLTSVLWLGFVAMLGETLRLTMVEWLYMLAERAEGAEYDSQPADLQVIAGEAER